METLENLTARLKTTGEIGDIVNVMKTLSSVSIRQYDRAAMALETYQHTVELGLQAVLRDSIPITQDARKTDERQRILIVIGSDRGLCGNFNMLVTRFARRHYLDQPGEPPIVSHLLAVGLRGAQHLTALGHLPDRIIDLPGTVDGLVGTARKILIELDAWRRDEGNTEVDICFNRRTDTSMAVPKRQRLFPIPQEQLNALAAARWPSRGLPAYRMKRRDLLPALLREQVFVKIYRAMADSLASEHACRLAAMQTAGRNIDDQLENLQARHRVKRQEEITAELLDLIAGFETARRLDDFETEESS